MISDIDTDCEWRRQNKKERNYCVIHKSGRFNLTVAAAANEIVKYANFDASVHSAVPELLDNSCMNSMGLPHVACIIHLHTIQLWRITFYIHKYGPTEWNQSEAMDL